VLLEDLQRGYDQATQGAAVSLPAASLPWSAWVVRQQAQAAQPAVLAEQAWWQTALADAPPPIPTGTGDRSFGASREIVWRLDPAATGQLLSEAARAYRMGVDEVLLTALAQTLGAWTGQASVLVDVEGHGRAEEAVDLSRTVGWFTTRCCCQWRRRRRRRWWASRNGCGRRRIRGGIGGC
jgi:hypothetical protein